MKTIIAGSRNITDRSELEAAIERESIDPEEIEMVVSGGADGVDTLGEEWADTHGKPVRRFLPDWDEHGKAAGPIRNEEMAEFADCLLLVWDGESSGSASMKRIAQEEGLRIHEYIVSDNDSSLGEWGV